MAKKRLQKERLWQTQSQDRDFRDETWSSSNLDIADGGSVSTSVPLPKGGYHAFYIDLIYKDLGGKE